MADSAKIRLLIVDDSILFRRFLDAGFSADPQIEIVGHAVDAYDAMRRIEVLKPDVVTLDVEMPKMSGIEFLKVLIPQTPVPVVLVSSLNMNVFDALSAGAVDFVSKPEIGGEGVDRFFRDIIRKVKIASGAKVRPQARQAVGSVVPNFGRRFSSSVIAIGASTGGTEATLSVVKNLPPDTPGILIVQHMPPGFTKMYADRMDSICKMRVREATDGAEVIPGNILIAPGDRHMTLVNSAGKYTVRCFDGEKVSGHRPSVDVLFESVAKGAGRNAIGVILTGMGRDGASGLLNMRKAGAYTIGQDKESCVVYGMPMVAQDIGAVTEQSSLEKMPDLLIARVQKQIRGV